MPVLPIRPEEMSGPTARAAIGKIEAVMLFPNNPKLADQVWESCAADIVQSALEEGRVRLDELGDPVVLTRMLRDAPRASDFQGMAHQAMRHGLAAGQILRVVIAADTRTEAVLLEKAKQYVSTHMTTLLARSPSTIENTIWGPFRPVAHFWASYLTLGSEALDRGDEYPFPCTVGTLAEFLGTAQSYLERGASLRAPRSRRTVLLLDEAWTIPAGLDLPRFDFQAKPPDCSN